MDKNQEADKFAERGLELANKLLATILTDGYSPLEAIGGMIALAGLVISATDNGREVYADLVRGIAGLPIENLIKENKNG